MRSLKWLSGCSGYNSPMKSSAIRVGTDIVEIARIKRALQRYGQRFTKRFLSDEEAILSQKVASIAGFWASKEAIAKALGCGIGKELGFHDIILTKDAKGAPHFTLSSQVQERFPILSSSLSISHDGGFAIAVVIIT